MHESFETYAFEFADKGSNVSNGEDNARGSGNSDGKLAVSAVDVSPLKRTEFPGEPETHLCSLSM